MEAEGQQCPRKTDFYVELPKVELHAHLNGSISSSTMKKLIAKKPHLKVHDHMTMIDKGKKRTLEECFQMFQVIHQLTTSAEDILMVTKDVIKEFADDGVKYLELRSTPRGDGATGMTKKTYVESILEGIKQCKQENLDIDVRYLMAIDRRGGLTVAKETVELAKEFFLSTEDTVLGLDLSGDPTIGQAKDFLEPLLEAKRAGLKLALHLAETDDKGVFSTNLSQEYQLVAETFNLTPSQVWDLSYESISYIFASDNTRSELRSRWNHLKPKVFHF
ncbi:Adenosine deaminase-like protein [Microtus ochrogaster]|uniref:Adenosine deaminase-like protein n=1 Tax=Microtus ochrogaster TaxID=79684 RepID=A0A8J6G4R2_MICOH|nr:Adenosine deaminase-like protein [Microtus ochrogaster]